MSYLVEFRKLKTDHSRIRSDVIEGVTERLPEIGKSFGMAAESLDPEVKSKGGFRVVTTSPVQKIDVVGLTYIFHTVNGSIYEVKVLKYSEPTH